MRSKKNSTLVGVFTITLVFLSAFVNMVGLSIASQCLLALWVQNQWGPMADEHSWGASSWKFMSYLRLGSNLIFISISHGLLSSLFSS